MVGVTGFEPATPTSRMHQSHRIDVKGAARGSDCIAGKERLPAVAWAFRQVRGAVADRPSRIRALNANLNSLGTAPAEE